MTISITNPFQNVTLSTGQLSNVTLGAVGSGSSIFDLSDRVASRVKKYQMYEVGEDALVLSVAWNRLRSTNSSTTTKLLDGTLFDKIIPEDRELAEKIRDFYSKKIMMLRLKSSTTMSAYREDLNRFIHSDGNTLREDMIGLVYRLPDFYKFDSELEKVTGLFNKKVQKDQSTVNSTFTPLERIERKTRSINSVQYWMKDQRNGNGAMVSIQAKNPLENVWNKIFKDTSNLDLYFVPKYRAIDGIEYMELTNWGLSNY